MTHSLDLDISGAGNDCRGPTPSTGIDQGVTAAVDNESGEIDCGQLIGP